MNEGLCWYVAMSEWIALSVYGICDGGECHFLVGMWLCVHGVVSVWGCVVAVNVMSVGV